jgi:hypothetical protein
LLHGKIQPYHIDRWLVWSLKERKSGTRASPARRLQEFWK